MGTKKVVDYFNTDGIIFFEGTFDISQLTEELYLSKIDAVKDNFERVQKYSVLDDWIFENYLTHYV
jgi:ribosome-binding ATPase YchF (GTP1/OBG family)